ncbi:uncharacterized protein LOC144151599 isoform X3 [Haemaphysalis longicornis]
MVAQSSRDNFTAWLIRLAHWSFAILSNGAEWLEISIFNTGGPKQRPGKPPCEQHR